MRATFALNAAVEEVTEAGVHAYSCRTASGRHAVTIAASVSLAVFVAVIDVGRCQVPYGDPVPVTVRLLERAQHGKVGRLQVGERPTR